MANDVKTSKRVKADNLDEAKPATEQPAAQATAAQEPDSAAENADSEAHKPPAPENEAKPSDPAPGVPVDAEGDKLVRIKSDKRVIVAMPDGSRHNINVGITLVPSKVAHHWYAKAAGVEII